jgi:two-component system NtrC family response regulator
VIDVTNLPESIRAPAPGSQKNDAPAGDEELPLREAIARLEKRMLVRALDKAKGNRSEAARQLGIGRPQLYAKMEEHGIAGKKEE